MLRSNRHSDNLGPGGGCKDFEEEEFGILCDCVLGPDAKIWKGNSNFKVWEELTKKKKNRN